MVIADTDEKRFSKQLIGKVVVSKSGKRFGEVGDLVFETKSGELIHIILKNPTPHSAKLELERTSDGKALIPCSSIVALGDFVVISDEDVV